VHNNLHKSERNNTEIGNSNNNNIPDSISYVQLVKFLEIERGRRRRKHAGHSGSTVAVGNPDAVDVRFEETHAAGHQDLGDFGRRHVLALPPEGVADAIDEVDEPFLEKRNVNIRSLSNNARQ
jgi:hypothetical protein